MCSTARGKRSREYWEKMTRVRLQYLPDPGPVGTAVRVMGLAYPDLLIEIDATAYAPELAGPEADGTHEQC